MAGPLGARVPHALPPSRVRVRIWGRGMVTIATGAVGIRVLAHQGTHSSTLGYDVKTQQVRLRFGLGEFECFGLGFENCNLTRMRLGSGLGSSSWLGSGVRVGVGVRLGLGHCLSEELSR